MSLLRLRKVEFIRLTIILMLVSLLASCNLSSTKLPTLNVKIGITPEVQNSIRETNETIRQLNETLKPGLKLDPDTQIIVQNLIDQIEAFNKSGVLGQDGVDLVRQLLNIVDRGITLVDKGIKIGANQATLEEIGKFSAIIDQQPDKWGEQGQKIVKLLDTVGTDFAKQIGQDIKLLNQQIAGDIRILMEQTRCTVDHTGQTIDQTAEQAGGKFISGILPFLSGFYQGKQKLTQVPGICTIEPDDLQLIWKDGNLVADEGSSLIKLSGFNFSNEFIPTVTIQAEDGTPYPNIKLSARRETSYRLTVNLQGKTFNTLSPGARIVFVWSDVLPDGTFEKPLLIQSKPVAVANFVVNTTAGDAPLSVQFFDESSGEPTLYFWEFGDGGTSQEKSPLWEYKRPGVYTVKLTVDNQFSQPNTLERQNFITVTLPPPPVAMFDGAPTSGVGTLSVSFQDHSNGNPTSWLWDFGDGNSSTLQNPPLHEYTTPGLYTVRLTVRDDYGRESVYEKRDFINVQEIPTVTPTPTPDPTPTPIPPPSVQSPNGETQEFGGPFGDWYQVETCPAKQAAFGISLRVEESQGSGDDTALNGIKLLCATPSDRNTVVEVKSFDQVFGNWGEVKKCNDGYLIGARLRIEESQGSKDDTGAVDAEFKCQDGQVLSVGPHLLWGNWKEWQNVPANHVICGIKTKVETRQRSGDDTALNDAIFVYCPYN